MTFAAINGERLTRCTLHVPPRGAWHALCDFEAAPQLGARVSLQLGGLTLAGAPVAAYGGVHAEQRLAIVVGGAGAWGAEVRARAYHNDASVKALLVAEDVAREIGESIGTFAPASERIGIDYVRDAGRAASRVLEDVIGDVGWFVDFAGVTHVGQRPTAPALLERDYKILDFDARERVATLQLSDPSKLAIGTVLASPAIPEAVRVHEYMIQADSDGIRILAWTGGSDRTAGRLAELWRRLSRRHTDDSLFGLYRYRVVSAAVDGRVSLQSVRRGAGLPDIEPISQWPGIPGAHAELAPGAEVLVSFVEGSRNAPIITHYAGKGGSGFVPISLVLGGDTGAPAARQGDTVEVLLPPAVFTGTIGGAPASGVLAFPLNATLGSIQTGSSKVKIAP